MEFFTQINPLLQESDITITLKRAGDKISVSALPKPADTKSDRFNQLSPVVMTGTPDELDAGFINAISGPIETLGLAVKADAFNDSLKQAEKSKSGSEKKGESKPAAKKPAPKPKPIPEAKLNLMVHDHLMENYKNALNKGHKKAALAFLHEAMDYGTKAGNKPLKMLSYGLIKELTAGELFPDTDTLAKSKSSEGPVIKSKLQEQHLSGKLKPAEKATESAPTEESKEEEDGTDSSES